MARLSAARHSDCVFTLQRLPLPAALPRVGLRQPAANLPVDARRSACQDWAAMNQSEAPLSHPLVRRPVQASVQTTDSHQFQCAMN